MKSFIKRFFDLIVSLLLCILLFPFFFPIVVVLFLTGEHQVFYFQERIGYLNTKFQIWKFATMVKNSSNLGTGSLTLRNDSRILPFGKFLRKTKINEFPQLINVILGNMSLVGPRPQMETDFLKFSSNVQLNIYNNKPGITSIGSIVFRDEEKWISNAIGDKHEFYKTHIAPYKGELELWYQNKSSIFFDIIIIFMTIWVIFFPNCYLLFKIFKELPNKPNHLN